MKIKKANGFIGSGGIASDNSGLVPKESPGMGFYYGTGMKNRMGRLRDSAVGYRPVSPSQLRTPPKSVV
jgi:hypothetical protein